MPDARDVVLGRIRAALGPSPAVPEVPRDYRAAGAVPPDVDRFCERVADYRATVHRVGEDELAGVVGRDVDAVHGARRLRRHRGAARA